MPLDPVAMERRERLEQAYNPSALGELLVSARVRRDLSRRELLRKVGITHTTLWRLESGERPRASDELAEKLADALDIDVFEIHAAQGTIPPALRGRVANLSASQMVTLAEIIDTGITDEGGI